MIREELDRLLCDAKSNAELKEKLLKTEQSENPIDNFCSLCRSHGYKISAGELFALGLDESDTKLGRISVASPMARALIGKSEGDEVEVQAPGGLSEYEIISVQYI